MGLLRDERKAEAIAKQKEYDIKVKHSQVILDLAEHQRDAVYYFLSQEYDKGYERGFAKGINEGRRQGWYDATDAD
jgi:flagellar biosynthesis/type III secretory pathway protein FliH